MFGTAIAVAAIGVATAFAAASPKPGFHYESKEVGNGAVVNVITMQASEDATLSISGSSPKCLDDSGSYYKGFALTEPVDASNGKFKFNGKATSTLPEGSKKVKLKLKGKFTSPKRSKGSYKLEGCKGKTKFKTAWTLGG